jgi:hypothetical protein
MAKKTSVPQYGSIKLKPSETQAGGSALAQGNAVTFVGKGTSTTNPLPLPQSKQVIIQRGGGGGGGSSTPTPSPSGGTSPTKEEDVVIRYVGQGEGFSDVKPESIKKNEVVLYYDSKTGMLTGQSSKGYNPELQGVEVGGRYKTPGGKVVSGGVLVKDYVKQQGGINYFGTIGSPYKTSEEIKSVETKKDERNILSVNEVKPLTTAQRIEKAKISASSRLNKVLSFIPGWVDKTGVGNVASGISKSRDLGISVVTGGYADTTKYEEKESNNLYSPSIAYQTRPKIDSDFSKSTIPFQPYKTADRPIDYKTKELFRQDIGSSIRIENKIKIISDNELQKAQREYELESNKIQLQYETGKISYEEANKLLNSRREIVNKKLNERIIQKTNNELSKETDLSENERKKIINKYKTTPSDMQGRVKGVATGLSYGIPVIGQVFLYSDITANAKGIPGFLGSAVTQPIQTAKKIITEPESQGMIIGGFFTSAIKTQIATNQAKASAIAKQKNLKVVSSSTSISVGKAIKVGSDGAGNTIWKVTTNAVTKLKDKTGKVIETIRSTATANVITQLKGNVVTAYVNSITNDLKRGGLRVYKSGNKVTIKSDMTKATGVYDIYQAGKNTYFSRGGIKDFYQGTLRTRIKLTSDMFRGWKIKIDAKRTTLKQSKQYSALSDAVFKRKASYKEVKRIKGEKVIGREYIYEGKISTDLYKNLVDVRGYIQNKIQPLKISRVKINKYQRKPSVEIKPIRDTGISFDKYFIPKKIKQPRGSEAGISSGNLRILEISQRKSAKFSAQQQASSLAKISAEQRITQIKSRPVKTPTIIKVDLKPVYSLPVISQKIVSIPKTKQKDITKSTQKGYGVSAVSLSQYSKQKDSGRFAGMFISGLSEKTRADQRPTQQEQSKVTQSSKQSSAQASKLSSIFGLPGFPKTPTFKIPKIKIQTYEIPKNVKLPKANKFKEQKTQYKYKRDNFQKKMAYQPSVGSFSIGYFEDIYPGRRESGIELRPIPKADKKYFERVRKALI